MASAVFSGSCGSRAAGCRDVLTEQKRHARVHVSPISMIVAVAASFPPSPPQHSPMLGHRASSQTVARPKPRRSRLIREKLAPFGIRVLVYDGRRSSSTRPMRTRGAGPGMPANSSKDAASSSASRCRSISRRDIDAGDESARTDDVCSARTASRIQRCGIPHRFATHMT